MCGRDQRQVEATEMTSRCLFAGGDLVECEEDPTMGWNGEVSLEGPNHAGKSPRRRQVGLARNNGRVGDLSRARSGLAGGCETGSTGDDWRRAAGLLYCAVCSAG